MNNESVIRKMKSNRIQRALEILSAMETMKEKLPQEARTDLSRIYFEFVGLCEDLKIFGPNGVNGREE